MKALLLSWSGGKDSALALEEARRQGFPIQGLLTTVTVPQRRVSMHGVREELLWAQAWSLGLPLHVVYIPDGADNETYERLMGRKVAELKALGIEGYIFGDTLLEDVREYRETLLQRAGCRAYFPLWQRDGRELLRRFWVQGFKATVAVVDGRKLDPSLLGRPVDEAFFRELPQEVDPLGENGEYHTFVWDGPLFSHPIPVDAGEKVEKGPLVYLDLLPLKAKRGDGHGPRASGDQ
ncbi:MAG: adenine nucleotide alpha hydrolase [Clostridiales bacterium]|nr:adenine nucleotide alpha hydrolase [Clostridiales bacterium]